MRTVTRAGIGILITVAALGAAAGCGKAGSSGTAAPSAVSGEGCAPLAGQQLVVLTDDKKLQTSLKKLNVQPIQAIEEVNMFKEDGNVIHFAAPKGMSASHKTFLP